MCVYNLGELEDYWRRKRVLQTPTEIVEVLKVLIFHNEVQDPLVFDGYNRQMVISIKNWFKFRNIKIIILNCSFRLQLRSKYYIFRGLSDRIKITLMTVFFQHFVALYIEDIDNK
jgi:hypothetical protein